MASNVTCALLLFLSLKEKKTILPDPISIFPSSASLSLVRGRWKQSWAVSLVGSQHHSSSRKSRVWLPCPFGTKSLMQDKAASPEHPFFPSTHPTPAQGPSAAPRLRDSSSGPDRACPSLPGYLSPSHICLRSDSPLPSFPSPLTTPLPSSQPASSSSTLRSHLLQEALHHYQLSPLSLTSSCKRPSTSTL